MRKFAAGMVVLALGTTPALVATSARATDDPRATYGSFDTPFREDGAVVGVSSTSGFDADTGCSAPQPAPEGDLTHPNGTVTCLPAGASVVQLVNGKVLYWNALEGFENIQFGTVPEAGSASVNDQSRVLDLGLLPSLSAWSQPTPVRADDGTVTGRDSSLFCSDQVQLADGRILDAGGTSYSLDPGVNDQFGATELAGLRKTRIFDPASNSWSEVGSMNYGRWYPGLVTLADGRVFVASGVTKLIKPVYPDRPADSGTNVEQTETYSNGQWTVNGTDGSGNRSLPLFPRLHLLPNGHVFYGAAGQAFNPDGQSYDEALWNIAGSYDPATQSWTDLGVPGLDTNDLTGSAGRALQAEPGFRGSTFNQQLLLQAPYDKASFITAGGVVGTTPGSYVPTNTTRIDTVTIGGDGSETLTSAPAGPLNRRRWYSSGVTLPDGTVLAVSGADLDEVVGPGVESPIRKVELFDPSTKQWVDVNTAQRARTYHNSAILLADGRVLIGGNAPIPTLYGKTQNLPSVGPREAANNFHDASFEIYNPPYLFRGNRPVIKPETAADATYGSAYTIETDQPAAITSVRFVRNPAFTHLVDGDQRVVDLPVVAHDGQSVTVNVPANPAVLPPGPYMVFIGTGDQADGSYIPSVAHQVFVNSAAMAPAHVAVVQPAAAPSLLPVQHQMAATAQHAASNITGTPIAATEPKRTSRALLPLAVLALVALAAVSKGTRAVAHRRRT